MGSVNGLGIGGLPLEMWFMEAKEQFRVFGENDEEFRRTLTADKRVAADDEMKADGMKPYLESFRSIIRHQPRRIDYGDGTACNEMQVHMAQFFQSGLTRAILGRRFCESGDGRLGLLPRGAEVGDLVCVVHGGRRPLLIRPRDKGLELELELVGPCYLHRMMDGEAFDLGLLERDIFWRNTYPPFISGNEDQVSAFLGKFLFQNGIY
jgi:hypothetical protein